MQRKSSARWGLVGGLILIGLACSSAPTPARSAEVSVPANEDDTRSETELARENEDERGLAGAERAVPRASLPHAGRVLPWLSPSHVAAAVRAREPAFGACQALGNSEAPSRDGAITVGWLVGADGVVANVTIGQSTFKSELVNDCVLSVARQVTFPASASRAEVFWTVRLRGDGSGPLAEAGRFRARH